jgi:hypothetical protein
VVLEVLATNFPKLDVLYSHSHELAHLGVKKLHLADAVGQGVRKYFGKNRFLGGPLNHFEHLQVLAR